MTAARHGSRLLIWSSTRLELGATYRNAVPSGLLNASAPQLSSSSICRQCQWRPFSRSSLASSRAVLQATRTRSGFIDCVRSFSSCPPRAADPPRAAEPAHTEDAARHEYASRSEVAASPEEPKISEPEPTHTPPEPRSPPSTDHETLPSHSMSRRSDLSKRMQIFMDDLLAKAAIAGQRVNTYTGTDYSGIETLRRQIVEQEQQLKGRLASVNAARDAHTAAHAEQVASQKEVVSLLERKTSWSPSDLDRYTSLIRSEHLHEQSVVSAKQALAAAEKELEEARAELERKERKQYHEEQIWSDTIRRNSTWVTFGLMGFNILLLIANIGIFEPWRRRRMVREVKAALDEKTMTSGTLFVEKAADETPTLAPALKTVPIEVVETAPTKEVEKQIDEVTEPTNQTIETLVAEPEVEPRKPEPELEVNLDEVAVVLEPPATEGPPFTSEPFSAKAKNLAAKIAFSAQQAWRRTTEVYSEWFQGPLSDDPMTLTKAEVTSVAVEGMAVGLAIMAGAIALLRQH
ncbi:hypothetical protein K461DRAFT_232293 [Myriangium duriaei CBS 260.36]|uniref:Sensitive to high expression protein 9, mitochondrial n=1 Tax=Myriangium duriaei CBS 260.36 TaxID=1168546 RepID=A0A9P4MDL8_9PEZI|nr:hypothetical protein K461DRAFT_232293 [Myriangium duriaei CBS 260.36]